MGVVDVVEDHDASLRIWVELSEGSGASLHVHRPPLEDVHERQPTGRAEAGAAVVHDAVGPHVLGSDLIHTAAEQQDQVDAINRVLKKELTGWLELEEILLI